MASSLSTVEFVVDTIGADLVSAKKMFGEYGLFSDGKMVGVICDDQLLIKPTAAGRAHAGPCEETPPYPGARPYLLIGADQLEDRAWLRTLVAVTSAELPAPKPTAPKKAKPAAKVQ